MRKILGLVVLLAGLAGLFTWAMRDHALRIEADLRSEAQSIVTRALHPIEARVSGRDIALSGTADTQAELDRIVTQLTALPGRRAVRAGSVTVLPLASPYDTALAKGTDGTYAMSGTAPSAAVAGVLETEGLSGAATLPLASGAPAGWADALLAGHEALESLSEGSFALTDTRAILSGRAETPAQAKAASLAFSELPEAFDGVESIELLDPGTVAFELRYDAEDGLFVSGRVPETLGIDGVARALGFEKLSGDVATTYGRFDDLGERLELLRPFLSMLDGLIVRVQDNEVTVDAEALPGLSTGLVASAIGRAMGAQAKITVLPGTPPEDGATRVNAATGQTETANAGYWLVTPDFDITKTACNDAAAQILAGRQIQFLTGSAELDAVSLEIINDLAGLVLYCSRPTGMQVIIGGHTDNAGDDQANYDLSVERAQAVLASLAERGVPANRMQAIGYGETEPVADNETEEGRAQNRRTSFIWPE